MDINWTQLLDQIQNLRALLEAWGITYEILMGLGIAALVLFLVSLREIVVWYMRISQLHHQMHNMSRQLSQIQATVNEVHTQTKPAGPVFKDSPAAGSSKETEEDELQKAARKKFNLDH